MKKRCSQQDITHPNTNKQITIFANNLTEGEPNGTIFYATQNAFLEMVFIFFPLDYLCKEKGATDQIATDRITDRNFFATGQTTTFNQLQN